MAYRSSNHTTLLVPRYVDHVDCNDWHICMADYRFAHDSIVTLEALCGRWAFGTLSRWSRAVMAYQYPTARFCEQCEAEFLDHRAIIDPLHVFRWRAPSDR